MSAPAERALSVDRAAVAAAREADAAAEQAYLETVDHVAENLTEETSVAASSAASTWMARRGELITLQESAERAAHVKREALGRLRQLWQLVETFDVPLPVLIDPLAGEHATSVTLALLDDLHCWVRELPTESITAQVVDERLVATAVVALAAGGSGRRELQLRAVAPAPGLASFGPQPATMDEIRGFLDGAAPPAVVDAAAVVDEDLVDDLALTLRELVDAGSGAVTLTYADNADTRLQWTAATYWGREPDGSPMAAAAAYADGATAGAALRRCVDETGWRADDDSQRGA